MPWAIILPMLFEFLKKCREDRDREEIEAGMRNPGPREYIGIRRVSRQAISQEFPELRGKKKRKKIRQWTNESWGRLLTASKQEVSEFLDEVEAEREE